MTAFAKTLITCVQATVATVVVGTPIALLTLNFAS